MKLVIGKFYRVDASKWKSGQGNVPLHEHIIGGWSTQLSKAKMALLRIEGKTAELRLPDADRSFQSTWWVQVGTLVPWSVKRKKKGLSLEKEFLNTLHSRRFEV